MKFSEVAHAFETISNENSRNSKTELLAKLFSEATSDESQLISYLSLGTLKASYKGNQFNFAEKNMLKLVAQLLQVDLKEFTALVKKKGDISLVLLASDWTFSSDGLSIMDVYSSLEKIMDISGTGAQEQKMIALTKLLSSLDVLSASLVIKIILGKMRLGFSDMTLLDALSWMEAEDKSLKKTLEHAYNLCADIGTIAYTLKSEGLDGIAHVKPTLGIPIRLSAAERAESPAAIIDRLGPCVAQPKLDGFRLQIHIDMRGSEPKVWFFSRNLLDMSDMFPDLRKALGNVKAATVIVEGEAIAYNEETNEFLPFQETVKRRRKHGIEEAAQELPLRLYLFDILYVNGEPVLSQGHEQRRGLLLNFFGTYASPMVKVIEEKRCTTIQDLADYFNEQISRGLEGLVVKRPDAPYQPGKRNFNWIKLKRHEEGQLNDTLDAVVLGYYAGKGRRADFGIGAFLVGVYNEETDQYETIAKVGTGLTDKEWVDLKRRCDDYRSPSQPESVICAPELVPDQWVDPTIVVIILADEITLSPSHSAGRTESSTGLALRFPRFMGYASDKKADQATTVAECRRLFDLQFSR